MFHSKPHYFGPNRWPNRVILVSALLCNGWSGYATGHPVMYPDRGWVSMWNICTLCGSVFIVYSIHVTEDLLLLATAKSETVSL